MKNILFPTDFSKNSWNALVYAMAFFKNTPCKFYVLHVTNAPDIGLNGFSLVTGTEAKENDVIPPFEQHLNDFLIRIKRTSKNTKHRFYSILDFGTFIEALKRHVKEKQINTIVMGTKGASGIKKIIVGSNTGDVITKVHCNTLIIPQQAQYRLPKEIIFPTDYTIFYSFKVLDTLATLVRKNNARLHVIHVAKESKVWNSEQKHNYTYLKDFLKEEFLGSHEFHLPMGAKIATAIEQFALDHKADMIVMVAKNLNFLQQTLFNSTIEQLSFQITTPFYVIHG
ncbi:universal stress protein [Spongiimicrobium salis]|uniref:universal stress protein n=1 Tax=Spongiimicrobium salis TaxID=1667022 RepID=UPI00374CD2B0